MITKRCRTFVWSGLLLLAHLLVPASLAMAASGISIGSTSILVGPSGTRNVAFPVTLSAPASSPVSVAYATSDGTATAGTDYTATTGTLTLATGATAGSIYVPVIGTTADASGLTFTVNLSNPVNAIITNGTGTCTITHDSAPGAVSISPAAVVGLVNKPQVFTTTVSSAAGTANLSKVGFAVGIGTPGNSLYAQYVVSTNSLYLANSSGTYIGGYAPGSNNVITTGLGTLNCAGTSVTANGNQLVVNWSIMPTSSLIGTQSLYLLAADVFGLNSGWQKLAGWTIAAEAAPVAVSVSPTASATLVNQAETLTTSFTYVGGVENLSSIGLNVGNLSSPAASQYAKYVPSTGLLYLANSSSTYVGGFAPGSNNTITTGLVTLNCASTTVTVNGQGLVIAWNLTPTASLAGAQSVYLDISDNSGMNSGWQNLATWNIFQESAPVAGSATPASLETPAGTPEAVTTTSTVSGGALNLNKVSLCVGKLTSTTTSLYAICSQSNGKYLLYLANSSGSYIGGYAPGSSNVVTTSLGNLNCASTAVTVTGNQIAVKWDITPAAALIGSQSVFVDITDNQGQSSNWQKLGAWTIYQETAPVAVSITPNPATSPVNQAEVLTTTASSIGGPSSLGSVGLSLGLGVPATSLYAKYLTASNLLYLANSSGNYVGGFAPGSNNTITTSLASLNCASTTVSTSGNNLVVNWSLTPAGGLVGVNSTYLIASDNYGLNSGWTKLGTWTIPGDTIIGQVAQNGTLARGVAVNLSGSVSASTTTDANGNYSFGNLLPGTYTVAPAVQTGVIYQSASQTVIFPAAQALTTQANFYGGTAYTISLQVLNYANGGATSGLGGVSISAIQTSGVGYPPGGWNVSGVTNSAGTCTLTVIQGGYSIAGSLAGAPFLSIVGSATLPSTGAGAPNSALTAYVYQVSGNISANGAPGPNIPVTLTESGTSATETVNTDVNGNYDFTALSGGAYTVTPGNAPGDYDTYGSPATVSATLPTSGVGGVSPNEVANFTATQVVAPPNDNFANAEAIGNASGLTNGTTLNSTLESGEPNPSHPTSNYGGAGYDSVWYRYTVPAGNISAAIFGVLGQENAVQLVVNVYTGSSLNALTYVNGNLTSVYFPVSPGVTYDIQVMDYEDAVEISPPSPFALQWATSSAPANDNFANAQVISGGSGSVNGTTMGATLEASEPASSGCTVWYEYTAPTGSAGVLNLTQGNYQDVQVFTGTTLTNLQQVATGIFTVSATTAPGTNYFIRLGLYSATANPGSFTLSWVWSALPANDDFANAQVLSSTSGSVNGSTVGATVETNEPGGEQNSVWYQFTAPASSIGSLTLTESVNEQVETQIVNAYTGTSVSALTPVTDNFRGDANYNFDTTPGTTYDIQVANNGGDGPGLFTLAWSWSASPANDNFANAIQLTGTSGQQVGTDVGATGETGEPNAKASVWYQFTAPAAGILSSVFSSNPQSLVVEAYTGSSVAALTQIAKPSVFATSAGTTYSIQVIEGYQGTGAFTLAWSWNPTPSNDNFANAAAISGTLGSINGSTIGSTVESGEPNSTAGNSVWYQYTAPSGPVGNLVITLGESQTVHVYTGTALSNLVAVPTQTSSLGTSFVPTSGGVYYWQIEAASAGAESGFYLGWAWTVSPPNDNFASAQVLTGTSGTVSGTLAGSSNELGEPKTQAGSVWYSYTVPSGPAGLWSISLTNAYNEPQVINLYTGASLSSLTYVQDVIGAGTYGATPGTTYYLQVEGQTYQLNAFSLSWSYQGAPANDNFANAQALTGTSGSVPGTTVDSTLEPNDPNASGGAGSIWYVYTDTSSTGGTLSLDLNSAVQVQGIGIYTGSGLGNLTQVAGGIETDSVATSPGVTYYIEVTYPYSPSAINLVWSWSPVSGTQSVKSGGSRLMAYPATKSSGHSA